MIFKNDSIRKIAYFSHHFPAFFTWKQIVDEGEEERLVLIDQLRQVHVPQHSHHDRRFSVVRILSLVVAQSSQNGQDVTQAEVVVHLWV